MRPELREKLARLPKDPGAYMMKDAKGTIIYVGKAKNLKSRVSSHFTAYGKQSLKTRALVDEIYDFEVILTGTEVESLLLERTLIKHHKPRFNILLRDDKEYPYLRVDFNETWPRIEKVRRRKDDGATYLGPFGSAGKLKTMLDATYRIFPLIRCSRHDFETAKRPCNYYHMKMCLGPCTLPVDRDQYVAMVKDALAFLGGRNRELVRALKDKMQTAADEENFEAAALYRDQLQAFESVTESQSVVMGDIGHADVIGFAASETRVSFHVLTVHDGFLVGNDGFVLRSPVQTEDEALTEFLLQYYDARSVPPELLLPVDLPDADDLKNALLEGHPDLTKLTIATPARGPKRDLVDMAMKNARYRLDEVTRDSDRQRTELELVRERLRLPRTPRRMECIDISNIQGTAIVASDVCFMDGKPSKEHYRHYTIRETEGSADDYGSIREVVRRRLTRAIRDDDLPDLLVIDGGKGQLSAAYGVVEEFQREHGELPMAVVSLAKSRVDKTKRKTEFMDTGNPERSFERVFFPEKDMPISLAPGTSEYRLLTQIRDEAHRFAITHHRKKRTKISHGSELEEMPGIGPAMRKKLIETFGGIEGVKQASLDQLKAVKGLRESTAVALHSRFRDNDPSDE